MNFRTTIGLVLLLAAIAAYFVFVESKIESGRETDRRQRTQSALPGNALFTVEELSTEAVDEVTIEWPGEPVVTFERHGTEWAQITPVHFRAKDWSIRNIIDNVASLRSSTALDAKTDDGGVTLNDASLNPPLVTVRLRTSDASDQPVAVHIGRKAVGGQGFALRGDDPTILLVNDGLHNIVLKESATDWRSRSLKVPPAKQADHIVLQQPYDEIKLQKQGDQWGLEEPFPGRADKDAVEKLLSDAGTVYIGKFVSDRPENLTVYGLDRPTVSLTVRVSHQQDTPVEGGEAAGTAEQVAIEVDASQPEQGTGKSTPKSMQLAVGEAADLTGNTFFATWFNTTDPDDMVVFTITQSDRDKIVRSPDDLRDPRLTVIQSRDVREIQININGDTPYTLVNGVDGWSFHDTKLDFEPDSGLVSSLVDAIAAAQATGYQRVPSQDSHTPRAILTLTGLTGVGTDTVKLHPAAESGYLIAQRNDEPVGYVIPEASMEAVFQPVQSLRDRTVLDLQPQDIASIQIVNSYGTVYAFSHAALPMDHEVGTQTTTTQPTTQQDSGGDWLLGGEEDFEVNIFGELLKIMFPLRCERWDSQDRSAATDSDQEIIKVSIRTAHDTTYDIEFNATGMRGRLVGSDQWFFVGRSLVGLLDQEFRDRVALPLSIDDIRRVEISQGEATTTVERLSDGGFSTSNNLELDQAVVGAMFDGISPLRVVRYVDEPDSFEAWITLSIETTGGLTHSVKLSKPDGANRLVDIDGRRCVLGVDLYDRLTADPTKKVDQDSTPTGE